MKIEQEEGVSPSTPIESLKLYADCLKVITHRGLQNESLVNDRTLLLIKNRQTLMESLPDMRAQGMSCLSPLESKHGGITFTVEDRPKWDNLQRSIQDAESQIFRLETAIRDLDAMNCNVFLSQLQPKASGLKGVEPNTRKVLSTWAGAAIARHGTLSVEAALLKDAQYQQHKVAAEARILDSKKQLAELEPKIAEIEKILSEAGV